MTSRLRVAVKPNAKASEILEWNKAEGTLRVAVAAPPEKNKANIELIKFLRKALGKRVRLVAGQTSKNKIIELEE